MYNILIADDEWLSRQAFRQLLQKHCPEISQIWEAENGQVAWELAKTIKPDIIILDIKMPVLSGMEAAANILAHNPTAIILMLTAYSDFSYVQEAINLGVMGYFLKPLKAAEIAQRLKNIYKMIDEQKAKERDRHDFEKNLRSLQPILHRELVNYFMDSAQKERDVRFYLDFLQYKISAGYFMLLSLGEDKNRDSLTFNLKKERLSKLLPNILTFWRPALIGDFLSTFLPIFVSTPSEINQAFLREESRSIAQELIIKAKTQLNLDLGVAIGGIYSSIDCFHCSFQEAFSLIHTLPIGQIICFGQQHAKLQSATYPYELEAALLSAIRQQNVELMEQAIELILSYFFTGLSSVQAIRTHLLQCFTVILRSLHESGVPIDKTAGMLCWPVDFIEPTFSELEKYIRQSFRYICQLAHTSFQNKNYALGERMLLYIENHVTEDISLESLADHINLSSHYVSKLFKEISGENFIDFVTRKRIQIACEALKGSDFNIQEIARQVGYGDQNYFCRLFKKHTGLTPKNYRKLLD